MRWDKDGTRNVVSSNQLRFTGELKRGSRVTMPWTDGDWTGSVISVETSSDADFAQAELDDGIPLSRLAKTQTTSEEDFTDSDDDIPLASLLKKQTGRKLFTSDYKQPVHYTMLVILMKFLYLCIQDNYSYVGKIMRKNHMPLSMIHDLLFRAYCINTNIHCYLKHCQPNILYFKSVFCYFKIIF